jgi:hypothetical protein
MDQVEQARGPLDFIDDDPIRPLGQSRKAMFQFPGPPAEKVFFFGIEQIDAVSGFRIQPLPQQGGLTGLPGSEKEKALPFGQIQRPLEHTPKLYDILGT